ncbi:MAG TPA: hypothetical protein VMK66_00745 [Myxococcales bacterium]|nr:hypothetical protein [Myxococcales bacterium]
MNQTLRQILAHLFAAAALLLAGCSVDAAGQIPCADDVSCPTDYPVCSQGKCIAGTSTSSASVAIVGVDGHAPADFLSGTVRVQVTARATSGVQSVALTSGSTSFPASATAASPPLFAFDVNTGSLSDGDQTLTATVTAGDGKTGSASGTLHVDNAKPAITAFTIGGGASATVTSGASVAIAATFSGGTGTVISAAGGSASIASGATLLVNPDANTSFKLRVTSRSGVITESSTTGQPPDVAVSVVAPVSFTGNFTVSPTAITQGQTGNLTFTAPAIGSWTSGIVKDALGTQVGTIAAPGGTAIVPIPATPSSPAQLAYTLELRNAATAPDLVILATAVIVTPVPQPVITNFSASSIHVSSGATVNFSVTSTGVVGNAAVAGVCVPVATVTPFNITLVAGAGSQNATAPTVAATSTCTYTATVQNSALASSSATTVVTVEPLPSIASFTFQSSGTPTATFAPGSNVVLNHTYNAQGGTARINGVTAGPSGGSTTFNNIQASTVYTLTVTNLAGDSATLNNTATATVSAQITAFRAAAATITNGSSTSLSASFGGSGASGNAPAGLSCAPSCNATLGATTISSGGTVTVNGTTNGALTYTLTVTPSTGPSATATANVTVVPTATATNLVADSTLIHQGGFATLTPTFSFNGAVVPGTATIVGSDGSSYGGLTSTVGINVAPSQSSTTYTLMVSNAAGTAAATTPSVTINVAPGFWSSLATSISEVRVGATVTALDNGKVLIAGGADGTNTPVTAARICDATGNCAPTTGSLNTARAFHTAVKIPQTAANNGGKVLIIGGFTAAGPATPTTSAEFYNPATDTFSTTTVATTGTVTSARARHIAVLLNNAGLVLIAGGTDGATNLNTALKYDAGTAAVPTTANVSNNMAQPRASFTGTLTGTTVLIVGGKTGNLAADRTAEIFDPAVGTGTFSNTGALPSGEDKRFHTAVLIGGASTNAGKVLISGGVTGAGSGTPVATQFLFSAGTFTSIASLAGIRSNHAAATVATDNILLCGGTSTGSNTLSSCERYNPNSGTGTMSPTAPMLEQRKDFGLAPITISSIVEILAAGSPATPLNYAETYNPN